MPEDLVDHILDLVRISASVKYAILYPHRTTPLTRLRALGEIVYSQSMTMPSSCEKWRRKLGRHRFDVHVHGALVGD